MSKETENYFKKLNKVECSIEKKGRLSYVSWADAWSEVKKIFPDSNFKIYENEEQFPFFESKYGIDVKVGVTINGIEHIVRLPVMDGKNKSMKDEVYTYETKHGKQTVEAATTFDINKAIQRAFAKAIAMHGIGLYVYQGEDLPEEDDEEEFEEEIEEEIDIEELQSRRFTTIYEQVKLCANEDMLSELFGNLTEKIKEDPGYLSKDHAQELGSLKNDMMKSFEVDEAAEKRGKKKATSK